MKRIGMLTSGGDCQALNAAMRGVVKGLNANLDELEIYGFYDGYKGLIYGNYRLLTSKDFSGILTKGGTILGTSRQPFKYMRVPPWWKWHTENSKSASGGRAEYHSFAEDNRQ